MHHRCEYHGRQYNCPNPPVVLVKLWHHMAILGKVMEGSYMWFCAECWEAAQIHYTRCGITWEF